jgi:hypothetical protein
MRLVLLIFCMPATATAEPKVPIPEPMVFDLVRPLGARKGETEVNTLAQRTHRSGAPWKWAPEVEYVFADNYAVELEFPFEDGAAVEWKAALQGTLGVALGERYVHGWQAIARKERHGGIWIGDMLYVAGYRMNSSWSVMTMQGVRRTSQASGAGRWATVVNPSVFRSLNRTWVLGLETNLVAGGSAHSQQLFMPQVQVHVSHGWILQAGAGVERVGGSAMKPAVAMRLTRVLR